ncbi:MAG: hypothetical protein ACHP82_06435 [Hyphomicrobiales bacterium]
MFRKLAVALVATSLLAGPVLAQGTSTAPASISQSVAKADTAKSTTTANVKHASKTTKHTAKMLKHRNHFAHVKHVKNVKHAKHMKRPAKIKTVG